MKPADSSLLAAVAQGDAQAFERLYRRYHKPLAGFLFKLTGRAGLVEELIDDVMIVVWRKAHTFAGRSRASTWIMGVAYRTALKAIRKFGRMPTTVEIQPDMAIDDVGPESGLVESERRDRVHRALDQLSPQHRAVVELTYFLGHTYAEIAEIVGCPENTVKTRMFHARKRLRGLLAPGDTLPREQGRTGT